MLAGAPSSLFAGTPTRLLLALACLLGSAAALSGLGVMPAAALGVVAVTTGLGAMLATALGWAGLPFRTHVLAIGLVALGATGARLHPLGSVLHLGLPLFIHRLATRGRLDGLGLGAPSPTPALLLGALVGLGLGAHLLASATLTLGFRVRVEPARYLAAVCYDVGAQVLATELFFRGALFNRAQRRWRLTPALLVAVAGTLLRYLVDPLLPHATVALLGMMLYVSLLAAAAGWLFARFGTPVPGLVAGIAFFAAYRALVAG